MHVNKGRHVFMCTCVVTCSTTPGCSTVSTICPALFRPSAFFYESICVSRARACHCARHLAEPCSIALCFVVWCVGCAALGRGAEPPQFWGLSIWLESGLSRVTWVHYDAPRCTDATRYTCAGRQDTCCVELYVTVCCCGATGVTHSHNKRSTRSGGAVVHETSEYEDVGTWGTWVPRQRMSERAKG